MDRSQLESYITAHYSAEGESPFARSPEHRVFRHAVGRKWFAIIMDVPERGLGLPGDGLRTVVNLKCDPRLIAAFRNEPGIYPGWHMNKAHWLSVALDGTAEDETIRFLLDMSYELTKK